MTPQAYNLYSRWLHWTMAFLLLSLVFLGWSFEIRDEMRFARIQMHKSIGILVLVLTFARLWLRLTYKAPAEAPMSKWQSWVARGVHWAFYALMVILPLTGWALVSTSKSGIPTVLFGVIPLPHLPLPQASHEGFEEVHHLLAKVIIYALVPLHVAGALKHHFIDKDATLAHMLPGLAAAKWLDWRWLVPVGVVIGALLLGYGLRGKPLPPRERPAAEHSAPAIESAVSASAAFAAEGAGASSSSDASSASDAVPVWVVTPSASRLAFATTYNGTPVNGVFSNFSADIAFDPDRLDASKVKVRITLGSADTGDADRDQTLESADFFDVAAHPTAIFEARKFERTGNGRYVAYGSLTLHGVKKSLQLPFSLKITGDQAEMSGTAEVDRLAFGVGKGSWADINAIPQSVAVTIALKARRQ